MAGHRCKRVPRLDSIGWYKLLEVGRQLGRGIVGLKSPWVAWLLQMLASSTVGIFDTAAYD